MDNVKDVLLDVALKYWAQWLMGVILAGFGLLWRNVKKTMRRNKEEQEKDRLEREVIRETLKALLRDRINQACRYHLKEEEISLRDREVLNGLFEMYFALKGNGPVGHLKEEIDALPTKF